MNEEEEKKWLGIWEKDKYDILETINKATPKRASSPKSGLSLSELSDLVKLPPREAQKFLEAMYSWGANIYVKNNRICVHDALAVTSKTHEDIFKFEKIEILGLKKEGLHFGVISDTHLGSTRTNYGFLKAAYRQFEQEGIKNVLHLGNVLAGRLSGVYRQVDLAAESLEEQLELLKMFPQYRGITTHFILGNTDCTFEREQKINPAFEIMAARPDFNYLGVKEADLIFHPEGKKPFRIRLYNEKLKFTYARSYQSQKKVDSMAGGEKPSIWLVGGTQQYLYIPDYQEVKVCKLPGLQHQTMRMRDQGYSCDVGFDIMKIIPLEKEVELYDGNIPCVVGEANTPKKGGSK